MVDSVPMDGSGMLPSEMQYHHKQSEAAFENSALLGARNLSGSLLERCRRLRRAEVAVAACLGTFAFDERLGTKAQTLMSRLHSQCEERVWRLDYIFAVNGVPTDPDQPGLVIPMQCHADNEASEAMAHFALDTEIKGLCDATLQLAAEYAALRIAAFEAGHHDLARVLDRGGQEHCEVPRTFANVIPTCGVAADQIGLKSKGTSSSTCC